MTLFKPDVVAQRYRDRIRETVKQIDQPVKLVGFLANSASAPSRKYAKYTQRGCEDVGILYEQRECPRLKLESELARANADPSVHGIMIYYPIFGTQQDTTLKNLIAPEKDVEGLSERWLRNLYANIRRVGPEQCKAVLPCTPLAVLKILKYLDCFDAQSQIKKTVTIFNRSEVVGRPLAALLAQDGATVYSFDVDGPILYHGDSIEESSISRQEALQASDIVVSGVPGRDFQLIDETEVGPETICINVASIKNFEPSLRDYVSHFVAKVGQVTVAMCLRNTLRLYQNYHR